MQPPHVVPVRHALMTPSICNLGRNFSMSCLKFSVRSKCTTMYFLAFWNTGACQRTRSAPDSLLSRLQERPFRHTNDLLQRHQQQTFSFDWRIYIYSLMHCWAKWWVGPYLVGFAAVEKTYLNRTTLHQISSSKCSPQLVYYSCRM